MHTSSGPRTRRALTALLIGAVAITLSVLGLPAPAFAGKAPTTSPTTAAATSPKKASASATCAAAKEGYATCFALRRDDIGGTSNARPLDFTPAGYGAGDIRSAYRLPAGGGAGTTVAIVDAFDDPNAEADLAVYRQQFGLSPCTTANGCF